MPKAPNGKKSPTKKGPRFPVTFFMCCSVDFVNIRFDQATFEDTILAVDPATKKDAPTVSVRRSKKLMAHLRYVDAQGVEQPATVVQGQTAPKPGDPLPKDLTGIILDLILPIKNRNC